MMEAQLINPEDIEQIKIFLAGINPSATIEECDNALVVHSLWPYCEDTWKINVENFKRYRSNLDSVAVLPQLWGIHNTKDNTVELLMPILPSKSKDLIFNWNFKNSNYTIKFFSEKPSNSLIQFLKVFEPYDEHPSEDVSGYYHQYVMWWRFIKRSEKDRKVKDSLRAWSAKIQLSELFSEESEILDICKRINYVIRASNARAPRIVIEQKSYFVDQRRDYPDNIDLYNKRLDFAFPSHDMALLDLYLAADNLPYPRFQFILFFNILESIVEWAIEGKAVNLIDRRLRDSRVFIESRQFAQDLIQTIKSSTPDGKSGDENRMSQVLSFIFSTSELKNIISLRKNEFEAPTKFIPSYEAPNLYSGNNILHNTAKALVGIRNHIVHHSKGCIVPCEKNDQLLIKWIWLIRKISSRAIEAFSSHYEN